jgi:RNA polymerase sigma factor (sigma-70 family)
MTDAITAQEDSTLIEMAVAGNRDSFALLMERHLHAIKRCIVSSLQDGADSDDVLQDVLFKVWRRLSTFRSESSFRTWVIRIALNEVFQWYRRKQFRRVFRPVTDLDSLPSRHESPERFLLRDETAKAVHRAVAKLPRLYQEPLVLREFEGLSMEETARSVQASVPATKTRLFPAKLMLSDSLSRSFGRTGYGLLSPVSRRRVNRRVIRTEETAANAHRGSSASQNTSLITSGIPSLSARYASPTVERETPGRLS